MKIEINIPDNLWSLLLKLWELPAIQKKRDIQGNEQFQSMNDLIVAILDSAIPDWLMSYQEG